MMTNNQDARPFVELKKDAEEFRDKFDEDIQECINFLDSKITALICDPDSLGNPARNIQQNALIEFSKEKYNIFISVKSLINAKEREWLDYISEMKKLFIENVEIFLAGTKLEVKLPSSEFQPSPGPRKSPGNRKYNSSPVTNCTIYPIISSIAKNIPVFGSPLRSKEASNVGDNVQSNRGSRISNKMLNQPIKSMTIYQKDSSDTSSSENEARRVEGRVQPKRTGRLSATCIELTNSPREKIQDVEMDTDENELELNKSQSSVRSNSGSRSSTKLNSPDLNTSQTGSRSRSNSKVEIDAGSSPVLTSNNYKSELRGSRKSRMSEKNVPVQKQSTTVSRSARGRRGKQAVQNTKLDDDLQQKDAASQESEESGASDQRMPEKNSPVQKANTTVSRSVRGRRGKQAVQNTKLDDEWQQKHAASQESEESGASDQTADSSCPSSKKSSGRPSKKAAKPQKSNSSSEENEDVRKVESTINQVKGRRGRQGAKNRVNDFTVLAIEVKTVGDNNSAKEKEPTVETVSPKVLRGRARALNAENSISDKNVTGKTSARGRKSVKSVRETNESGTSKSPRKITIAAEAVNSYDLDLNIPVARPAKASTRRKTMLPNMEDTSGSEIIPGNPSRARSKRKTIGGDLELNSATPSKRLKVGHQKNISSVSEEDNEASDNLLESDDNYSEWMALKSVDGKIPTRPAIYEVKVWRAKKTAYLGSCESLRQQLTLYKLKQNSGHKHLDKFLDRNYDDIQIRYEVVPSIDVAKGEVKNRIKSFVAQYNTTPAYN